MKKKIVVKKKKAVKRQPVTEGEGTPQQLRKWDEATRKPAKAKNGKEPEFIAKAKEPEFVGKASSGGKLTKAQDKEYRRQMGWPAR